MQPAPFVPGSSLRSAAWIAFVVHLLAGVAMAAVLSQGLETNGDLHARLHFLARQTLWWNLAWLTWNGAALTMLWFVVCFAQAHGNRLAGRAAVCFTTAAIALDLGAEAIEMGALPDLARTILDDLQQTANPPSLLLLHSLHRLAVMLTGYGANGLYSLSALLLAWSTRREYRYWVWPAGAAVGVIGLALSGAVLVNSVAGMVVGNVLLGPCLLYWLLAVALVRRPATEDQPPVEGA
jgi:hypothetical protein